MKIPYVYVLTAHNDEDLHVSVAPVCYLRCRPGQKGGGGVGGSGERVKGRGRCPCAWLVEVK